MNQPPGGYVPARKPLQIRRDTAAQQAFVRWGETKSVHVIASPVASGQLVFAELPTPASWSIALVATLASPIPAGAISILFRVSFGVGSGVVTLNPTGPARGALVLLPGTPQVFASEPLILPAQTLQIDCLLTPAGLAEPADVQVHASVAPFASRSVEPERLCL